MQKLKYFIEREQANQITSADYDQAYELVCRWRARIEYDNMATAKVYQETIHRSSFLYAVNRAWFLNACDYPARQINTDTKCSTDGCDELATHLREPWHSGRCWQPHCDRHIVFYIRMGLKTERIEHGANTTAAE